MIRDERYGVQITHKPTGMKAFVRAGWPGNKSLQKAKAVCLCIIRAMVRTGPAPTRIVRKYDIDGPIGTFIRDEATGRRFVGDDVVGAVLERGELERVRGVKGATKA